jgi:translation elongation factor EF-Tu-like GTPase
MTVELQQATALEERTRFAICEGNRTVGAGSRQESWRRMTL